MCILELNTADTLLCYLVWGGCNTFATNMSTFVFGAVCCIARDGHTFSCQKKKKKKKLWAVAAWFTQNISKCCRPVNKTLTCLCCDIIKPLFKM